MINYNDNEDILNNDNDKSSNNDNDSDDYINDNWFIFVSFQVFDKSHNHIWYSRNRDASFQNHLKDNWYEIWEWSIVIWNADISLEAWRLHHFDKNFMLIASVWWRETVALGSVFYGKLWFIISS